jgi:hypothetical protein
MSSIFEATALALGAKAPVSACAAVSGASLFVAGDDGSLRVYKNVAGTWWLPAACAHLALSSHPLSLQAPTGRPLSTLARRFLASRRTASLVGRCR